MLWNGIEHLLKANHDTEMNKSPFGNICSRHVSVPVKLVYMYTVVITCILCVGIHVHVVIHVIDLKAKVYIER